MYNTFKIIKLYIYITDLVAVVPGLPAQHQPLRHGECFGVQRLKRFFCLFAMCVLVGLVVGRYACV